MSIYRKFRITKKVKENDSVVSLYLKPADNFQLQPFKPGQHLMFKIGLPKDDVHRFRNYSFSESYNKSYYRVSIKKEDSPEKGVPPGICSFFLFEGIQEGDIIEAKGPLGEFCINPEEMDPVVFVAGGIGITPLLSMAKSITKINPERKMYFFYGVNGKSDHSFQSELAELEQNNANLQLVTFYANVEEQDIPGRDYDFQGFINVNKIADLIPTLNLDYYVCGPTPMMDYVKNGLQELGVDKNKLHFESFVSKARDTTEEELEAKETKGNEELQIEFLKSHKKLPWDNRYDSVLAFAEDHDIEIPSGCLFGDCGTCLSRINKGEVKYTHPTMVKPQEGEFLPCSTVPITDIIIEA